MRPPIQSINKDKIDLPILSFREYSLKYLFFNSAISISVFN